MVFLRCAAMDTSTLEIFWTFNGVNVSSNDTNNETLVQSEVVSRGGLTFVFSTLEIFSVGVSNTGEYSCIATNGEANATAYFILTVVAFGKNYPKHSISIL